MTGRDRGFTLVEVLVGLVLLGLLAAIILSATRVGLRAWSRAESQIDAQAEVAAAQTLLRRVIRRAYPAFASPDPADPRIRFDGGSDSLTFVGPLPGAPPDAAWATMRLHLAATTLVLDWQAERGPGLGQSEPLLGAVTRLEIAYLGRGQPAEWQGQWSGQTEPPALVRIRVARGTGAYVAWPELVVAPRVTANAQCAYDVRDMTCRRTP